MWLFYKPGAIKLVEPEVYRVPIFNVFQRPKHIFLTTTKVMGSGYSSRGVSARKPYMSGPLRE
jgi:hypothetical protein